MTICDNLRGFACRAAALHHLPSTLAPVYPPTGLCPRPLRLCTLLTPSRDGGFSSSRAPLSLVAPVHRRGAKDKVRPRGPYPLQLLQSHPASSHQRVQGPRPLYSPRVLLQTLLRQGRSQAGNGGTWRMNRRHGGQVAEAGGGGEPRRMLHFPASPAFPLFSPSRNPREVRSHGTVTVLGSMYSFR